jgi:hypothetical protein
MANEHEPGVSPVPPQGIAGGPGPSPPGFDDGTPKVTTEGTDAPPLATADEAPAERTARSEEEAAPARGDPEEPDPS